MRPSPLYPDLCLLSVSIQVIHSECSSAREAIEEDEEDDDDETGIPGALAKNREMQKEYFQVRTLLLLHIRSLLTSAL